MKSIFYKFFYKKQLLNTRIALWNRAGDSVYGMAARCARCGKAGANPGRPGLSFSIEAHRQGTVRRRCVGMASGLRLLVPQRLPVSAARKYQIALDRSTSVNGCLNIVAGTAFARAHRPRARPRRGPERRRSRPHARHPGAAGGGAVRTRARRRGIFSQPTRCTGRTRTARRTADGH